LKSGGAFELRVNCIQLVQPHRRCRLLLLPLLRRHGGRWGHGRRVSRRRSTGVCVGATAAIASAAAAAAAAAAAGPLLVVAVQVACDEIKGLKLFFHFIGSRVETGRRSSYGSTGLNLYSPTSYSSSASSAAR
jgi:hypothetical protein